MMKASETAWPLGSLPDSVTKAEEAPESSPTPTPAPETEHAPPSPVTDPPSGSSDAPAAAAAAASPPSSPQNPGITKPATRQRGGFTSLFQPLVTKTRQTLGEQVGSQVIAGFENVWANQIADRLHKKEIWASFLLVQRKNRLGFNFWQQSIGVADLASATFLIIEHTGAVVESLCLGNAKLIKKIGDQQLQLTTSEGSILMQFEGYKVRDDLVRHLQRLRMQKMREKEEFEKANPYAKYGFRVVKGKPQLVNLEEGKEGSLEAPPSPGWKRIEMSTQSEQDLRAQIEELAETLEGPDKEEFVKKMEESLRLLKQEAAALERQKKGIMSPSLHSPSGKSSVDGSSSEKTKTRMEMEGLGGVEGGTGEGENSGKESEGGVEENTLLNMEGVKAPELTVEALGPKVGEENEGYC
eukprot:comp20066_c3_seq1/m.24682 comp20066_c3_seq1/g.24682  ORF comp20066_c3_seq1/g.24682 comp20066_c3_seq1/m.24682 type:complete len:412 (-) comp20066_c3_seq1:595-1830(-)